MEKIQVTEPLPTRPLTVEEQAAKPTPKSLEQIRVRAGELRRALTTEHLSRIGPSGAGLDIICR
ncbi:hypothetical protein A2W45_03140 [Candidatus Curtissbacteria bacterium RIFCSPHIGHO2_12_41_11]|uniref:Uncharacterized protein n=3 Tax=Candidatus Curtissiibacteriota TaxID=1752717 RepID=A0A1F5HQN4_9BACT|nr:MAG: hypothetical protein UU56_C0017G0031 [Candidatus Curtissbacteria bacterium GW2011_GWA2_41_24]OGD98223.1 MAG: hypothetical protein A2W45_03140 [Candidatus Curtissbacteria bacterium RIFCSPHIGHO2_12_41_11]OGE06355.1 MAG: hypothetical protein A2W70_01640 [Candidatus Curtissbacteria bacterium RIFCSPLOWO2_02_41_11]